MLPVATCQNLRYSPVAQAQDAEGEQEAQRHLQPLDQGHVGKAEVELSGMLRLGHGERQHGEQGRRHPDQAAAEAGVGHTAAHGASQRHEAVKAHPGEEEDAAVHVDLQEEGHKDAEGGLVVVVLLQIEHLNQRVRHQDQVGHCQVHKVQVRSRHTTLLSQVYNQDEDVPNETHREQEYGVEAGEDEADGVMLVTQ